MYANVIRRSSALMLTLAVAMAGTVVAPAAASHEYAVENGYVPLRDGTTKLKYTLFRPHKAAPLPTLLVYNGYTTDDQLVSWYLRDPVAEGAYNLLAVTVRGSGCSGGSWEFLNPQEAEDGVDVIDWTTQQSWSDGRVALVGGSYSAMPQFAVAAEWATEHPHRSDGLVAIAPHSPIADIYRDVAYPGGIANHGFSAGFVAVQGGFSAASAALGVRSDSPGDPVCLSNQSTRPKFVTQNTFTSLHSNPWDGAYYERSPIYAAENIDVPVFGFFAWQDQILSGRAVDVLSRLHAPFHAIVTNGDHASYEAEAVVKPWRAFLDYYVRGIDNGFGEQARVQVWWESNPSGAAGFRSEVADWPPPQARPMRLFFSDDGALQGQAGTGAPDSFVYSPASQAPLKSETWQGIGPHLDRFVETYTSEPLTNDLVVLGSASVDLWLSSSQADVDLQATITEVQPDGKEIYIQSGWLRASHRALDETLSTETRPYQTHQQADSQALVPSEPTEMRIEIFPFGHVFREGSRIRVEVGGPTLVPSGWRLATLSDPASNSIHHDGAFQSSLVLSVLPGHPENLPSRVCEELRGQPCRET